VATAEARRQSQALSLRECERGSAARDARVETESVPPRRERDGRSLRLRSKRRSQLPARPANTTPSWTSARPLKADIANLAGSGRVEWTHLFKHRDQCVCDQLVLPTRIGSCQHETKVRGQDVNKFCRQKVCYERFSCQDGGARHRSPLNRGPRFSAGLFGTCPGTNLGAGLSRRNIPCTPSAEGDVPPT
jgi:hypothetical protein